MSSFVYDLTALPDPKSDLTPVPPGADINKYLPAAHWNTCAQATYDLRDALRKGVFQGLTEQASDPAPTDNDAYWWLQNTGVMRLVGPTELNVVGTISAAAPTLSTHLTTKAYVDALITGLNWKAMVRLASTPAGGNVTLSGVQSVDGNSTATGNRVLLKNQTDPIENGIWIANDSGAWTRATDMPAGSHAATTTVFVDVGSINEDTSWFCNTEAPNDVVGTHAIQFQVFSNTISQHNALSGLQGGTSSEYYHLTSAQHTGLVGIATGGVAFASATGVLATDASNLFWDNSTKRLGIGTTTPRGNLDVRRTDGGECFIEARTYSATADNGVALRLLRLRGNEASPSVVQSGDWLGYVSLSGQCGTLVGQDIAGALIHTLATETWSMSTAACDLVFSVRPSLTMGPIPERMRIKGDGKVGIGTDSPDTLLDVHGDLTVTGILFAGALGCWSATANATLVQYDVVYGLYASSQKRVDLADADAESTSRVLGVIAIGGAAGDTVSYVTCGVYMMSFDATVADSDHGKPVYLSTTAGKVTLTPPGAGTVLIRVGYLVGAENGGGGRYENSVAIHIGDEFQQ